MPKILFSSAGKKIVLVFLLFLTVVLGLYFRAGRPDDMVLPKTNNISSYYYDIAARFNADLVWPRQDNWHFAPGQGVENAPPLLAYSTVYSYRLVHFFSPGLAFDIWAFSLPVLVFLVWAAAGFYLIKRLLGGWLFPAMFLILLALAPSAITLTKFGHYTEEFLGSFWLFLAFSFFMLWRKERRKIFFVAGWLFTVFLILTWQQFHIIFVVYGLAVILFLAKRKMKEALGVGALALVSLLTAQIFSIYLLHSAYLPFQMIYESYLGLMAYDAAFLKIAMSRNDWGNLTLLSAVNYFGIWGNLAWLAGLFYLRTESKKSEGSVYLLAANLVAAALMFFFVKSVNVFLPFFLLAAAYGAGRSIEIILNLKHDIKEIF